MIAGFANGELILEERARGSGRRLRGRFPYNTRATLSDGGRNGRPRKEQFASRAFSYRIDRPEEDIHLLIGHSYDRPLASRGAGTLKLTDEDYALTFEATLTAEMEEASWVRDFLAAHAAGLMLGISPGFRLPPERAVKDAERIEEEHPSEGTALIRTVMEALLYELSVVTRPAYREATVEAEERSWDLTSAPRSRLMHPSQRWR